MCVNKTIDSIFPKNRIVKSKHVKKNVCSLSSWKRSILWDGQFLDEFFYPENATIQCDCSIEFHITTDTWRWGPGSLNGIWSVAEDLLVRERILKKKIVIEWNHYKKLIAIEWGSMWEIQEKNIDVLLITRPRKNLDQNCLVMLVSSTSQKNGINSLTLCPFYFLVWLCRIFRCEKNIMFRTRLMCYILVNNGHKMLRACRAHVKINNSRTL